MKTLLIDNYDSFTFNLFQLLAEVNGREPVVVRNDEASWDELLEHCFDNVVLSPGPGRPDDPADFGVCGEAIRRAERPLLGVCLGHQGICWAYGARVERAPEPFHGRLSPVAHAGAPLFAGIPGEFEAVRYHSLCVDPLTLPPELEPLAWSRDGLLMAVGHRSRPVWGVQFHPESIAAEHGRRLLANFRYLSGAQPATPRRPRTTTAPRPAAGDGEPRRLIVERRDGLGDAERAFLGLYADSEHAFWLDSADPRGRFSFVGDAGGPLAAVVSCDVAAGTVTATRSDGTVDTRRETIFDYLAREQARLGAVESPELPFDFRCGFAGYLGYELKASCGGEAAHESPHPDAAFVLADRMIAFDHRDDTAYLLCLTDAANAADGERWIAATAERLSGLGGPGEPAPGIEPADPAEASAVEFALARSPARYLDDIAACRESLLDGDSYEICLTNQLVADVERDPLDVYRALRRVNPAPYAAYLRFGGLAVLSSSPERFLRVDRAGRAEAKPIKGTAPRGATAAADARLAEELRTSEKDRAENLMIVDLLRNDLGRVCEVGSVTVPHLMEVESFATVHQLVSTVRGRLRPGLGAPDCVRACFPPGSMTGAPKRRTMEIVDALEQAPRGVYSGAIGYFGAGGGCDLGVTIRTVVLADGRATIGVGGAIVVQSDPEDELREALLKGMAPMRALDPGAEEEGLARALDSFECPPPTPKP